jgi:hypothetical protein
MDRWVWLQPYWLVVKHWGWGFTDEWTFASEAVADKFFDSHVPKFYPIVDGGTERP